MANKKLIIETEVRTDGLDVAAQKLGELKQISSGIKIQYDIDGKPLDIVVDKTVNLKTQVNQLTKALRTVKEGSDEFKLLSTRLSDTQDKLAQSNAKSRDLLASFQLIPGPIGEFATKLNGAIGLLKTFSSFSLKDLRFQFKETVNDIKDIVNGFLGLQEQSEETQETIVKATNAQSSAITAETSAIDTNTEAQDANIEAIDEGTSATNAGTVATLKNKDSIDAQSRSILTLRDGQVQLDASQKKLIDNLAKLIEKGGLYRIGFDNQRVQLLQYTDASKEQLKLVRELTDKELALLQTDKELVLTKKGLIVEMYGATKAGRLLGGAMEFVGFEFQKAAVAVAVFETALAAIGIGLVIAGLVAVGNAIFDAGAKAVKATRDFFGYKTAAEIAAEENERLTLSFKLLAKSIDETQQALKDQTDIAVLQAKIAGKSEEELFKIVKDGFDKRVQANKDGRKRIEGELRLLTINTKLTEEEKVKKTKELEDQLVKNSEKANDLFIEGQLLTLNEDLRIAEKKRNAKKNIKKDETNDDEKANALLLKLQQEFNVNVLAEERKKQDKQLQIDKENEEREVNALKLSQKNEGLRAQLLEEIRKKYGLKVIELNRKRQEEDNKIFDEDQKKLRDYQGKIFDIVNSGDENELNRAKAARTRKFEDDKAALQADTNFQKETLENKIRILLALEKAYRQDVQKLDDDDAANKRQDAIKKLDDELKFLQIRGEAVREGTIAYFNNLRDISKKAEQRELADLADRAIKEKLTTEQVEAEKTAIKKKYANERKQIDQQELEAYLQYAQQILGAVSNVFSQIGQVNALEQQVAQENLKKSYIEANEQAKKTITNQEELEKQLAENKKKFAKDEDSLKKAAFEQNKKIQIAQAVIATLQGAVQAFTSLAGIPVVGPALGAAAAAAALIFGYKQVALIKKTTYQSSLDLAQSETVPNAGAANRQLNYGRNYAKGGMIGGRRHAEGGTIIEAEKGEAIMTRGAVATFGPLLSLMNQAGGGTSFNSNLLTTRQDAPAVAVPAQQQQTPVFKTYVVSQELTTEAQRQARLKNLSVI